jgi:hypothetical protein
MADFQREKRTALFTSTAGCFHWKKKTESCPSDIPPVDFLFTEN